MSNRSAIASSVLAAVVLIAGASPAALAQTPGAPVTVQSGSYLSPTATRANVGFLDSFNCYYGTTPSYQQCDVETLEYSSALFTAAVGDGQAIQISSFKFYLGLLTNSVGMRMPNLYDVYMGIAGGPLSLFGTFGYNYAPSSPACNETPSATCAPETVSGLGFYLYDPSLGNLEVKMVETLDWAVGECCAWYDQGQLVTRFDGIVVATPEPSTTILLGSGLVAVFGLARRRALHSKRR
jgi:hypothetical protein